MVRYSIEQGLLGPGARILLALTTGLVLHLIADRLHCRRGPSDVFAALAGGASITLYAALLAALYQLPQLAPLTVFIGMALVSLATMALALRQGPLLAALGMLGGYLVPLLVQSGQDLIEGALIYALILTASALLLMRYVWRRWLWFGALAGALFWWAMSYPTPPTSDISRTLYLFALSWMLLAIPSADWLLAQRYSSPHRSWWSLLRSGEDPDAQRILLTLVPILLAQGINLWQEALTLHSAWSQLLLPLLLLYCAGRRPALAPLPGALLLILAAALLLRYLHLDGIHLLLQRPETQQAPLIALLTLLPLLASTCALHQLHKQRCFSGFWASLAAFAPLLFLGLGYLLFTEFSTDGHWALATLIAGLAYLALALRSSAALLQTVLLLAAHAAWSLAAVMWLREATLTLALALQLISLASLYRRTGLALLPWLIRLLLLGILIRLALNPWLVSYLPGQHWSLWTYGGATLCCFIASYLSPRSAPLQRWLQGAGATLLLLTLGTELRYWLYDGAIFSHRYSFTEASINTLIWGAGGLIYQWRSTLSQTVAALYRTLAAILLSLATANYLLLLVLVKNPLWGETVIAPTPLWNLLLLAYGVPVVLAVLAARFYPPLCAGTARRAALLTCGLSLLLFVSLEIRHLWQGALDISLPTSEGEQYTYSAVWLLLAASGMIVAIRRTASGLYRAAMALLLVDILKIFLVDLAGLEGLWRVASFMGLGLVLLGLAWLHQQLTPAEQPSPAGTQQAPDSTRRP